MNKDVGYAAGGNVNLYSYHETTAQVPQETTRLPHDPAVIFLDVISRGTGST